MSNTPVLPAAMAKLREVLKPLVGEFHTPMPPLLVKIICDSVEMFRSAVSTNSPPLMIVKPV